MTERSARSRLGANEEHDVDALVRDLSDWTGFILKIEGLLNWENPRLLLALLSSVTGIFMLFHWFRPTVLSTIGWLGLSLSLINFIGPIISARISHELTQAEAARRYREFCRRLVHAYYLIINLMLFIRDLRTKHPLLYLLTCFPLLLIGGFIGSRASDSLLLYIVIVTCILTPGIRHRGVLKIILYPFKGLIQVCHRCFRVKVYDRARSIPIISMAVLQYIFSSSRRVLRLKRD